MQDEIFDLLVEKKEISWKSIIYDLVRKEQMDPWNVDVSKLTDKYVARVKKLQEHDLHLSGTVLLAAATLLRMKSQRLVGEDMDEFDRLIASTEVDEDEFYAELEEGFEAPDGENHDEEMMKIIPRTPQPRKRKVSVYDLVNALEKALEVKHRRLVKMSSPEGRMIVPEKKIDITLAIKKVYKQVKSWFISKKTPEVKFSQLLPEDADKEKKIFTFLPLLHLATERKIDVHQERPFEDFTVRLAKPEQKKAKAEN